MDLFDKKLHLDQKIMVMNKQLTIWHNEFDTSKTPQEHRAMKNAYKVDQALINDFDTREDDFFEHQQQINMKISQSPWYHRLIISAHYSLLSAANPFGVSDNLVLINYILEKNSKVLSNLPEEKKKNYEFNMLDFITDNTEKLTQHLLELRSLYPREVRKMQTEESPVSDSCYRDDALGDSVESDKLSIVPAQSPPRGSGTKSKGTTNFQT